MQELIDEFRHLCYDKDFHFGLSGIKVTQEIIDGLEKKYLEKEKEQIADAFRNGSTSSMLGGGHWTQYYNQTYNK